MIATPLIAACVGRSRDMRRNPTIVSPEALEPRRLLAAQPVLVRDINPTGAAPGPFGLVDVNGTVFFAADNGRHGRELWRSDGTPDGTVRVADIFPGGGGSNPDDLT